jgi:predicted neuraminidase
MFNWFTPRAYKVELPRPGPLWSVPTATETANTDYSIGPSQKFPGGVMLKLEVDGSTVTWNMSEASAQQMIALMQAAMITGDHDVKI